MRYELELLALNGDYFRPPKSEDLEDLEDDIGRRRREALDSFGPAADGKKSGGGAATPTGGKAAGGADKGGGGGGGAKKSSGGSGRKKKGGRK